MVSNNELKEHVISGHPFMTSTKNSQFFDPNIRKNEQ